MSRLNKTIRNHIVESVIKSTNLPERKEAVLLAASVKVRQRIEDNLPKGFLKATEMMPSTWFDHIINLYLPKEIAFQHILDGSVDLKDAYGGKHIEFAAIRSPYSFKRDCGFDFYEKHKKNNAEGTSWESYLSQQLAEANKIRASEVKARSELRAFLSSVNTTEAVITKMPELERHLPAEVRKTYPVAVSTGALINVLDGLGFDTGA